MKRIVILVLAAMMAGLCACSAQTVWETVSGGCVRESDGASSVICVRLPQDAVEEVFAEAGTQHVYTQPGGGYEIVTQVLPAASMQSVVRSLSGFDASALRVYESGSRSRPVWQFAWYAASDEGGRLYRCKVISEGAHCYALTFSAPEGSGTAYDTTAAELFSSMELQPA